MANVRKRKTTKRRKSPAKKRPPKQVSAFKDREAAFQYWAQHQNVQQTADHFKVSRNTIYRIMRKDNWRDRLPGVIDQVRSQSDHQAARQITDNLEAARELFTKIVGQFKDKDKGVDASVSDFVRLARYIDEFEGTAPGVVAAEQLNDVIAELIKGTEADRSRIVANAIAGLGITDRHTVSRATKIWLGRLYSQN